MTDYSNQTAELSERIQALVDDLERHARVLESIEEEPEDYDADNVEAYLGDLDDALAGADFLDQAEEALAPLEEAVEEAEAEFLASAKIVIDDREIEEGVELNSIEPFDAPEKASLLVESPKVNQVRGAAQILELPDGRSFTFDIEETLVADVAEDKTGDLELILSLQKL